MITVKLDKERHLRLTLRGMLEFENITGISIFKGFDLKKMALKETTALLWACLIHEDKELTYDIFIDMIDLSNITQLTGAVTECINESLPDAKESAGPLAAKS